MSAYTPAPLCEAKSDRLAVIAIGRNEGERLVSALRSALASCPHVYYVDSGSTDGSVAACRAMGGIAIALDLSKPFTAARARNTGFAAVQSALPDVAYVQFIDGDCELDRDWIATARTFLDAHPDVAVVFGRRRERYPEASIYNRLCDISWQSPPGDVAYFGGDALVRVSALRDANGYRDDLIAGEEPELAVRLRALHWKVHCLDAPMTLHDADMTRFDQWWRRTLRTGYAYAQGAYLHGRGPSRHWVRETIRALAWGLAVPVVTLVLCLVFGAVGLFPLLLYALQGLRVWQRERDRMPSAGLYVTFTVLGKIPEALGVMSFAFDRLNGKRRGIIEYK